MLVCMPAPPLAEFDSSVNHPRLHYCRNRFVDEVSKQQESRSAMQEKINSMLAKLDGKDDQETGSSSTEQKEKHA